MTFNTNGLGDNLKLKRLLRKIEPIVEKGGLALLQETHIVKTDYLKILWKNKFASNCVSTNSAGVIILYSNDFEMIDSYSDNEGRILIIAIKNEDRKVIVVNTYFPNNHRQSLEFANKLYEEILRFQQNFPEFDTVYTGDINTCLSKEDCLNRKLKKICRH
jgi:exonuclease III